MDTKSQMIRFVTLLALCFYWSEAAGAVQFVSLKSNKTFLRAGPSKDYPIKWIYEHKGEPMMVIATLEDWKKVKDFKGDVGWVHDSVVSDAKTGIIKNKLPVVLYKNSDESSKKILRLEPGVRINIKKCEPDWCKVKIDNFIGWIRSNTIWGDRSYKK